MEDPYHAAIAVNEDHVEWEAHENMWTELHGRSANPCPAGSSARNMSPRNRERIPSATTTWSATTAPVTVSSL